MKFFRLRRLRACVSKIILFSLCSNIFLPILAHGIESSDAAAVLGGILSQQSQRAPREPETAGAENNLFFSSNGQPVCCPLPRDIFIAGDLTVGGSATISGPVIFPGGTIAVRQLQLVEDPVNGTESITLQAPALIPINVVLTLPATAGIANQVLTTDGNGILSWTTAGIPAGVIYDGGNSFGAPITIGTNDNYALNLETFGNNRLEISSAGQVTIPNLAAAGIVHTDNFGTLSTSLITNADVALAANISDQKLATISTAGKVANSATTATSANTANAIVARDASGNFSAGTITATLSGTATAAGSFSGSLAGDVTGTQSATVVSFVGGQTATNVAAGSILANAATSTNTASAIVRRDASGNFAAGTITANVSGNATTATSFTGSLSGDVTGTQSSTVVAAVGGQSAANVAAGTALANAATSSNTASAIVRRDASGNFAAGTITANVTGAASSNVLKAGDTMSGNLVMSNQNQIQLQELLSNGTDTIGLRAPASFGPSYTLTLPTSSGSANQVLTTDGTGVLSWTNTGSAAGYILNGGNSFGAAATIGTNDNFGLNFKTNGTNRLQISNAGAVSIANLSGSGDRYVQVDLGGNVTATLPIGIENVVQVIKNSPTVVGKYYSDIKSAVDWANANAVVPTAIIIGGGNYSVDQTITITNQNIRSITGSFAAKIMPTLSLVGSPVFVLAQTGSIQPCEITELLIDGSSVASWKTTAGGIGIQITGSGQFSCNRVIIMNAYQAIVMSGAASPLTQSISITNCGLGLTSDCVVLVDNGASVSLNNCLLLAPGTQLVRAQHTNILSPITQVLIDGGRYTNDIFGTGDGILVKDTASVMVSGILFRNLQNIFTVQDSATLQTLGNISVAGSVTNYQQLTSTAKLYAIGDIVRNANDTSKYVITNSANVVFDLSDADTGEKFTGRFTDSDSNYLTFLNGHGLNNPSFDYKNNWFGWRGDVFNLPQASLSAAAGGMRALSVEDFDATFMSLVRGAAAHSNNSMFTLATYQSTGDPSSPDLSLLRAWQLNKEATTHNYGMNFWDGAAFNRRLTLTPLGNMGLGTATPNSTLEVGTGQIASPAGTAANPAYTNSGNLNAGIYFPATNTVSLSTAGVQRFSISPAGVVSINNLSSAGIVHNDASGNLSTSLIVGSDITNGTITDNKLATITTSGKVANSATTATSSNTASAIVARDGSGNFSAGTITASLNGNVIGNVTGASSLNVLKSGDTMTGPLILSGVGSSLTVGGTTGVQALNVNGNLHALSTTTFDQGVPGIQTNVLQVTTGAISGPNQFNSVKAALDSITTNSATNRFVINIGPGIYIEDTLTLKPFVGLAGLSAQQVIIEVNSPSKDVIIGCPDATVQGVTLRGATDTGKAAVVYEGGLGADFIVKDCAFGSNNILWRQDAVIAPYAYSTLINSVILPDSSFVTGISAQASAGMLGFIVINGLEWNSAVNPLLSEVILVSGPTSNISANNLMLAGLSAADGIRVQDGATTSFIGCILIFFNRAIFVPNAGLGPVLNVTATSGIYNVQDLVVEHPLTTGSVNATFETSKVAIDSAANLPVFLFDPIVGGTTTVGPLNEGLTFATVTNISTAIQQGSTLGVIMGGVLSDGGNLDVDISAGTGYLMVGAPGSDYLKYVTWDAQTIPLPANQDSYIWIDNAGVAQSALSQPDLLTTISLGKARTTTTTIAFLQEQPQDATHLATDLDFTLRQGFGPVYEAGSIVSKNGTVQLDVSPGSYFFGSLNYSPAGGTAIAWDSFYSNGSGNLNIIEAVNTVDYDHYDDGSGTLAVIPVNQFARHAFYVVNDNVSEHYLLVYGQVVYPTLIDAQNGTIPPEPGSWNGNIALIASIIVENTAVAADRISEIRDERPRLGFKPSGVSVVTDHGDLTGLLDDDHPQYLLDNGTRAMSGNLNLGGNNITSVALINGIDITNNAARYLPNGANPLATAAPVSIGTANSIGIANSFARSDHIHNHDNQPGGTLHAVATTSVAGFMSAADKTLLDSINPALYVLKSGSTMTGTLSIDPISGNALTVNGTNFSVDYQGNVVIGGSLTLSPLSTGIAHVSNTGVISSSLIVNNDITNGTIADTKLATISTAGKVANSATTATAANTANAIVARDASGNFVASSPTFTTSMQLEDPGVGTNAITIQSPTPLAASYSLTLPADTGTSGYVLSTDGTGVTSWLAPNTLAGLVLLGGNTNGAAMTLGTLDDFSLNLITNGSNRISIANNGQVTISNLNTTGVVHTNGSGLLTTSSIVNADISAIAAIADTKLAPISTSGKVLNSATTATSTNSASSIVARDASGNFSAGIITAALLGNVTGNVTGSASLNVLKTGDTMTGNLVMSNRQQVRFSELLSNGVNYAAIQAPSLLASDYTLTLPADAGSANQVLTTDGTGVLSWQSGSALPNVVTQGGNSFGSLMVVGTNDANGFNLITNGVDRISISSTGAVAIPNLSTTGVVHNDTSGNLTTSLIINADIAVGTIANNKLATTVTSANTANSIVARDASGNFSAGTITANLSGNATTATTATNFTGSLSGDVTGTQGSTVVATVGGQTAANVAAGVVLANAATSTNTASALVRRDASGNFSAGTITANLIGNVTGNATTATTATTATNFTGSLSGDVTGTQGSTVVATVGGQSAANIASGVVLANAATSANTASAIVRRDASGNFVAGTITANLTGSASGNVLKTGDTMTGSLELPAGTSAAPSLRFTGSSTSGLSAQVADTLILSTTGVDRLQISDTGVVTVSNLNSSGVVHTNNVGLLTTSLIVNNDIDSAAAITDTKLATITTAGKVANSATTATSANTPNAIVARDALGNFVAETITANSGFIATTGNIVASSGSVQATSRTAAATGSSFDLIKNRTGGVITSGDTLGNITFQGFDGTGNIVGSKIVSVSSGTIATNRIPSDLEFFTHPNSTTASTQRMVIGSAGNVTINTPDSGVGLTIAGGGLSNTGGLTSAGATTLSALGIGVVQASSAGVLSSSAGANGQLLIGAGVGVAPVWANLTSAGGTIAIINGAGTINLETSGATANSFVTGSGTATPSAGALSVPNGSNINTTGAGSTLTINLVNSPSVSGSLTAGTGVTSTAGNIVATAGQVNAGTTITAGTGITATTGNIVATAGQVNAGTTMTAGTGITATTGNIVASSGALQATAATNTTGLVVTGNGTANAATITAGNGTGGGLLITGGAGAGVPLQVTAAAGTGSAATFTGNASSTAVTITPGTGRTGLAITGNTATAQTITAGTNSSGLSVTGNGTANAVTITAGAGTGGGLLITGGSGAGVPLQVTAAAGTGNAVTITGGNSATAETITAGTNQSAWSVTGNGTANAATITAGNGTGGGLLITGGAGSGIPLQVTAAAGTGSAATITGNASSTAATITAGAGQSSLQLSAGTAAIPAIVFAGSTTTGLSAPSANTLNISTSGVARMNIDSTGSVTNQVNYKVHAYRNAVQAINVTTANIVFNTSVIDTNANFNTGTGTYTAPITGVYFVGAVVTTQTTNQPSTRTVNINKNGVAQTGYSAANITNRNNESITLTTFGYISLTAGDTVNISYTTTSNDNIQANSTHVSISYFSF